MNHCEIVKDLLPLYIDEACSEDSRRMVEEHLKNCRACREEYRMMKYPAPAEKRMKDFKVIEEQILKEGKEQIETGVMHKIAGRMLWIDLFLNLLFLLLGSGIRNLFLNATKLPWYREVRKLRGTEPDRALCRIYTVYRYSSCQLPVFAL